MTQKNALRVIKKLEEGPTGLSLLAPMSMSMSMMTTTMLLIMMKLLIMITVLYQNP